MKKVIEKIQKSIYNPKYYAELLTLPFSYSVKYFFSLVLLITVFLTIATSIPIVIEGNRIVHEFPAKFFTYFPDELELTIAKGVVTSNVTEPYLLPIPAEMISYAEFKNVKNAVVIDTQNAFSLEQFNAYETFVWIGKNQVAIKNSGDGNGVRIEQFGSNVNYILNEQALRSFEAQISPYYFLTGPLIIIITFFAFSLMLYINFIFLLFGALLIFIFAKLRKLPFSYWKSYQIGLHAITLALLFWAVLVVFRLGLLNIPFLPTFIMLMVVYMNFKDYRLLHALNEYTKNEQESKDANLPHHE